MEKTILWTSGPFGAFKATSTQAPQVIVESLLSHFDLFGVWRVLGCRQDHNPREERASESPKGHFCTCHALEVFPTLTPNF